MSVLAQALYPNERIGLFRNVHSEAQALLSGLIFSVGTFIAFLAFGTPQAGGSPLSVGETFIVFMMAVVMGGVLNAFPQMIVYGDLGRSNRLTALNVLGVAVQILAFSWVGHNTNAFGENVSVIAGTTIIVTALAIPLLVTIAFSFLILVGEGIYFNRRDLRSWIIRIAITGYGFIHRRQAVEEIETPPSLGPGANAAPGDGHYLTTGEGDVVEGEVID